MDFQEGQTRHASRRSDDATFRRRSNGFNLTDGICRQRRCINAQILYFSFHRREIDKPLLTKYHETNNHLSAVYNNGSMRIFFNSQKNRIYQYENGNKLHTAAVSPFTVRTTENPIQTAV